MAASIILRPTSSQWLRQQARKLPDFLLPLLAAPLPTAARLTPSCSFSTSPHSSYPRKDKNRSRGVSAVRRTGAGPLSVSMRPLPRPVKKEDMKAPEVDQDHGLWGFFNAKRTPITPPDEDYAHGRAWTVEELRNKDWDDLYKLWWVCCKERNRIATMSQERVRLKAGYGAFESADRNQTVIKTQRAIKDVLTRRWYAWEDATKIARVDPRFRPEGKDIYFQAMEPGESWPADEEREPSSEGKSFAEEPKVPSTEAATKPEVLGPVAVTDLPRIQRVRPKHARVARARAAQKVASLHPR